LRCPEQHPPARVLPARRARRPRAGHAPRGADRLSRRPEPHRAPEPGGGDLRARLQLLGVPDGTAVARPAGRQDRIVRLSVGVVLAGIGIAIGIGASAGCYPALDDRPWLITEPRIVGWKVDPPEANPGAPVTLQLFALSPAGPPDTSAASW